MRFANWLLKHVDPNSEAALGDIVERFQRGKSRLWYWRQFAIVLALGLRGVVFGLITGSTGGAVAILENILNNNPGGISFFPDLVSPLLLALMTCLAVLRWRRCGLTETAIRHALRQGGKVAGFVWAISHIAFAEWWFGRTPLVFGISPIAVLGFFAVFFMVKFSGRLALSLSRRAHEDVFPPEEK